MFFVFIIQSLKDRSYYIGSTSSLSNRLVRYNSNYERYTRNRSPWVLVWCTPKKSRAEALILEKKIKNMKSVNRIRLFIKKYSSAMVASPEDHT